MPMPFLDKLRSKTVLAGVATLMLSVAPFGAAAFDTQARSAYVYDMGTSTVLLQKNAEIPLPPASMSKLMTLYVAFEFIKSGLLNLDDTLPVSEHAASYTGSTMFLNTTDRVKVRDLILGIIVLSGNDACAVLAEALSPDGTEAGFADLMTQKAKDIGLTSSTFVNSNGWPAPGQRMSMRDLGVLADRLIVDHPEFYPLFAERVFEFDGRAPANTRNRNPLLGLDIGADGLKTGHTQEAGYGLVGSAKQGDRRVIFVVSGLDSAAQRAEESEAIVNWAFRQFTLKTFAKSGDVIARARVWNGDQDSVGLQIASDLDQLVPVLQSDDVAFSVELNTPLPAPITQGQQIGELVIDVPTLGERRVALVAASDVNMGGFFTRLSTAAQTLMRTITQEPEDVF